MLKIAQMQTPETSNLAYIAHFKPRYCDKSFEMGTVLCLNTRLLKYLIEKQLHIQQKAS